MKAKVGLKSPRMKENKDTWKLRAVSNSNSWILLNKEYYLCSYQNYREVVWIV